MKLNAVPQSSGTSASGEVDSLLVFLSDELSRIPEDSVAVSGRLTSLFDKYSVPFYAEGSEVSSSESAMSEQTAFQFVKKSELQTVGRSVLTLFDAWLKLYAPVASSAVFPEEEQLLMRQLFWDFDFMLVRVDMSYDDWDYQRRTLVKCMLLPWEHVAGWSVAELQDGDKFRVKQGWKYLW